MQRRSSRRNRAQRRPNPAAAWGGIQDALVRGTPVDVPDTNLTDPAVRKGVYFTVSPDQIVLPTRNGVKPADMRFFSFMLTVATGAQFGTAGFITAYFTTDEENPPGTAKWDAVAVNSVLDFKEHARISRTSIGWHKTVAGSLGEIRTTFNISRSNSMKNYNTNDANNSIARVYFFYPAGLNPTVRLYARCAFEGVENDSVPVTLSNNDVRYDTVYDVYSLDFLRKAFNQLARPVFFNAHIDGANIVAERGLFVLYSDIGKTEYNLSRPTMDLLIESDLETYRPSLNGLVFPGRDPVTNLLTSSLSTWCRQKVFVSPTDGLPNQFWWAHVQPGSFNVISGRDVQLVDCYERMPTVTPRNRTAAEILSSCAAGATSLAVSANDRPPARRFDGDDPVVRPLLEGLVRSFAPLNAFLNSAGYLRNGEQELHDDQSRSSDGDRAEQDTDDFCEEDFVRARSG